MNPTMDKEIIIAHITQIIVRTAKGEHLFAGEGPRCGGYIDAMREIREWVQDYEMPAEIEGHGHG
jgi:hypothetical protein